MTLRWTDWEDWVPEPAPEPGMKVVTTPYVDWLWNVTFDRQDVKDDLSLEPLPMSRLASGQPDNPGLCGDTYSRAPLPPFARRPADESTNDDPAIELTWRPDPDCAIVGVIDSAIALSHERFRRIDGGTRFLSAWLMGSEWRAGAAVPFGREIFRTEIDRLMWRAGRTGRVDEAMFDQAAGLTNFRFARGDRRLEENATHGTHVADLAAGFDLRDSTQDEARRRLPIIAVGLPPRSSMGASGNFLEFFAIHAVEYIIDRADRIWKACEYDGPGFPIVINLSYGLQAGGKDGQMLIEKVIRAVDATAERLGRPIRVILPAGNDLTSEGAAQLALAKDQETALAWRVKPEDHTPNYCELWSKAVKGPSKDGVEHPVSLRVSPPGGPQSPANPGKANQMTTLYDTNDPDRPVARIYCISRDDADLGADPAQATWHRLGYIICTRPTLNTQRMLNAPAGCWCLSMTPACADGDAAFAYVQSDQSLTFGSETGLVSTFAHPDFETYDQFGRMIDTHAYPSQDNPPPLTDDTPPIQRRGTLNAIASLKEARVIGSCRVTDGKPSYFSSAATTDPVGEGRAAPTALLPGEAGAARFGLLAAGSKSGSAATMQGTSFSTALATRHVALAMLDWIGRRQVENPPPPPPGDEAWFQDLAANHERNKQPPWPGTTAAEKAGAGRIMTPPTGRHREAPPPKRARPTRHA